jgi:hypothetical protein
MWVSVREMKLTSDMPLACGRNYYFYLEVGALIPESLEGTHPIELPTEYLPIEARLKVVLFTFKNEIEVVNNRAAGELKQETDGSVVVTSQPVPEPRRGIHKDASLLTRRLFFPVRTPQEPGVYRLRCSIYYEQVLVQSRLITASVVRRPRSFRHGAYPRVNYILSRVFGRPQPPKDALISTVDYTLTHTISPAHLAGIKSHQLSLMLNSNGKGTTELRLFGDKGFIRNAAFDESQLQDLINQARGALRRTAWGDEDPWKEGKTYKYEGAGNFKQLESDLIMLAKKGYSFYDKIIEQFETSQKEDDYKAVAALMREPGMLQIALKESARYFIPAALIYDYPLDNGLNDRDYSICPAFHKALPSASPLQEADCFSGRCPTKEAKNVVCPSGFWGYRHYLGMPLTLAEAPDAPTTIQWQGSPHLTMAVSTDLELREIHEKALRALATGLTWDYADTRDKTIQLLKQTKPHLVYFYCHGGLDDNEPYIEVGPARGPVIKEATFRREGIKWNDPRPLVFINGCHTTALEPKQAMEFAGAFVKKANAAGVIGTEITVFESLAHTFAENFLRRFIVDCRPLGESVRNARLDLLKLGNPLGLAYVPFVIASICMLEQKVVS